MLDSIRRHSATALGIARRYMRKLPKSVQRDDLEQAALIGLWEWKRSHPDEETPGWLGGLVMRVRGSIQDELRRQDVISRYARARGERPRHKPIEEMTDLCSLEHNAEEQLVLKQEVHQALSAPMSERDAQVIDLAYFRDMRFREIGDQLGCTESRVSQIHDRATGAMRAQLDGDSVAIAAARRAVDRQRWQPRAEIPRSEIARLKAEGKTEREAAAELGVRLWVVQREFKRLAPLAKCGKRREQ